MRKLPAVFITVVVLLASCANAQAPSTGAEPLAIVSNGLYGYIDHNGTVVIAPQFLWATDFDHGYGVIYVCGRFALIDKAGKLFPIQTPRGGTELRPKKIGDKFGFRNGSGELKIKPEFDEAENFSDGLAAVRVGKLWGFIDTSGNFAIPPQFGETGLPFNDGVGTVEIDDTQVLIDRSGKVLAYGYEFLSGIPSEGLVPVSRDDKYGYLDVRGAVAIPLVFDFATTFGEGLAAVRKGSKWGYIDKKGSVVIPFKFDDAGEFGNGLAPAKLGGQTGFINHTGAFAFRLAFKYAPGFFLKGDVSRFWTESGEFGYVNTSGSVVWGPAESPDHAPILGWTAEDEKVSCDVLSDSMRRAATALPPGVADSAAKQNDRW